MRAIRTAFHNVVSFHFLGHLLRSKSCTSLTFTAALLLSACVENFPVPELSGNERSKYDKVGIKAGVGDIAHYVFNKGTHNIVSRRVDMGWDTLAAVERSATEILESAGASVSVAKNWPYTDEFEEAAVEIGVYLGIGEISIPPEPFQSITLDSVWLIHVTDPEALGLGLLGTSRNYCEIAIHPIVVDIKSKTYWHSYKSVGVENLSIEPNAQNWASLTTSERSSIIASCKIALRRAVGGALKKAGVFQ
jgi:hypothetical protein